MAGVLAARIAIAIGLAGLGGAGCARHAAAGRGQGTGSGGGDAAAGAAGDGDGGRSSDGGAAGAGGDAGSGGAAGGCSWRPPSGPSVDAGAGSGGLPEDSFCLPWKPSSEPWSSLPAVRPANLGGLVSARLDTLRPSADGQHVYAVGVWLDAGHPRRQIVRSGDLGATWCLVPTAAPIADVVPSPAVARVLYAITTPRSAADPARDLLRTDDGGATWVVARGGLPEGIDPLSRFAALTVANDPGTVWLQGQRALHLSRDGGATWTTVALPLPADPASLRVGNAIIDVAAPNRVLFMGIRPPLSVVPVHPFVFTSTNWGATFIERDLPAPSNPDMVHQATVDIDASSTLYAGLDTGDGMYAAYEVWRSRDWGTSWTRLATPDGGFPTSLGSPLPGALYAFTRGGLVRSTDAGLTWNTFSPPVGAVTLVAVAPDSMIVRTGLTLVATADAGATWQPRPIVPQADALAASAAGPHPLWVDGGRLRSDDGLTWTEGLSSSPVGILTDGADADVAYTSAGRMMRTEDRGRTWEPITFPTAGAFPMMAVCPPPRSCLYGIDPAMGTGVMTRSEDRGRTWTAPTPWTNYDTRSVVTISPTDQNHLLQGRVDGVYESRDAGLTWTYHQVGGVVVAIVFLSDADVLAITDRLQLFGSADGGTTWTPSPFQPPPANVRRVLHSTTLPRTIFIATGDVAAPLYRTDDGGATWTLQPPLGGDAQDEYSRAQVLDVADTGCGFLAAVSGYGLVQLQ